MNNNHKKMTRTTTKITSSMIVLPDLGNDEATCNDDTYSCWYNVLSPMSCWDNNINNSNDFI